jgi:very-short-patch-repair endonuclease/predicted transcriptional regulator of viral defense system
MRRQDDKRRVSGGPCRVIPVAELERRAQRLAARQYGVVSRGQLLAEGFSAEAIDRRVRSGRWRALHRGVYLIGPLLVPGARTMAAVLACQSEAYASHHTAALLHRLPLRAKPRTIHVTVIGRNPGSRQGITLHRVASMAADEITEINNIPVTTPARAILDLAATLDTPELEQLVAEAYAKNLATRHKLESLIARYPTRPGTRRLRELLEAGTPAFLRSRGEQLLLALIRKAQLPPPAANARLHGYEVDLLWPQHRVVVEFDSQAFHSTRPKRERDSRRDQELILTGYVVLRVTWRQLTAEPEALIARIAAALAQRAPSSLQTTAQ